MREIILQRLADGSWIYREIGDGGEACTAIEATSKFIARLSASIQYSDDNDERVLYRIIIKKEKSWHN